MIKKIFSPCIALLVCIFSSCSHGPVGMPHFKASVQHALPVDDREVLFSDTAQLYLGSNLHQMLKDRASLLIVNQPDPMNGVVAVTSKSVWMLQWNSSSDTYRIIRRFNLEEVEKVELDKFIRSKCVLLTKKDYSVSSITITKLGGQMIDFDKTVECFDAIFGAHSLKYKKPK